MRPRKLRSVKVVISIRADAGEEITVVREPRLEGVPLLLNLRGGHGSVDLSLRLHLHAGLVSHS